MSGTIVPSRVENDEARVGSDGAAAADASAESLPSVGQQLSTARLAKGLAASDVAKALKLSLRQVEALEADDWPSLPCKTIIRGFVRNYARLLGLDSDRLMAALDRLTMPQGAELEMSVGTPVSLPQEGKVDRRDFVRVLSGLIVLLLAVAAYFFLPQQWLQSTLSAWQSATQQASEIKAAAEPAIAPEPAEAPAAPAPDAAAPQAAVSPTPAVLPEPSPTPEPPAASATAATAVAPASLSALQFSFAQPSWVEVRDRSGQVIFSKKNDAGTERVVEGEPPFAVIIGNAGFVTLQYKGKPVDLSKRSKEDVARLTVE